MELCFIGNSHVSQLYYNIENIDCEDPTHYSNKIIAIYKQGASIKGLVNINSTLGLIHSIHKFIYKNPSYNLIYFLGQVDIEFGYYYKCIKDNIKYDINVYISHIIDLYESHLLSINEKKYILSINPCVLTDNKRLFEICFREDNGKVGFYSEVNNSINYENYKHYIDNYSIRYNNNRLFNKCLKEMCTKNNFKYIDFWHLVEDNGLVKDEYIPKHIDHHLLNPNDNIFKYISSCISNK
jgi:hypothetical protein